MRGEEMKYWIISDTHFGHKEIIDYCGRPEDHEQIILHNLIVHGSPNDCLIHLGDFAFNDHAKWCAELCKHWAGRKILVIGNHDKKSAHWYMTHGFDFACESFKMKYGGKIICFSHKPQAWDGDWQVNIHGHLHNLGHRDNEYKDLKQWHRLYSPELEDYKPLRLDRMI